ncbi:hypothetical protein KUTeg_012702 [Tegillarca granosa]|uniref:Carboxylic ester hydrolase n=1 Tax=Tegillarca granosa TaxID=220873 RepID=A0ABQ9F0C2_TEGGR|nr:hypothetical protein KUTeg_012702 [Tegillarca granosa]
MVFQWVKSNIEAFGGNPSAITIFGQSSGAMGVSFHMLIPYNKGLFQRAIVQSGTVFSSPVLKRSDNQNFMNFLNSKLNCTSSTQFNTSEFVQCLKRKSSAELNGVGSEYLYGVTDTHQAISIAPSIDGELIIADPDVLLSDKNSYAYKFFRSLDYMAGTTNGEASHFLGVLSYLNAVQIININLTDGISNRFLCEKVSQDMAKVYFKSSQKATKALCNKYSYHGNEDKLVQQGILVADMNTDLYFIGPTVKTLKVHENKNTGGKTYQYFFTKTVPGLLSAPVSWFTKAPHGTELAFLFGGSAFNSLPAGQNSFSINDSFKALLMWVFKGKPYNSLSIKNPNSASLPTWEEYGEDKNYLHLDLNITANRDLFQDKMKLILEDIPRIISQPPNPPPPSSACQHSLSLFLPLVAFISYIHNFIF